jgi:protein ImuB
MEWACIGLPQLALDKRQREMENPAQPLALLTGPIQRRVLHAVNVAAQGFGLSMGMPLASAQALCPQVQLHPFDPVTTEQLRQRIAAWAYRFSAQVSTDFSEAVVLEIGRSRRLFGEWPELQARLRDELQAWGITHRLCAAPYPTAAHVLAMAGDEFDGWGVDASRLQAALGCLPVHRAGLDAASVLSLQRLGLRQLRQVFDGHRHRCCCSWTGCAVCCRRQCAITTHSSSSMRGSSLMPRWNPILRWHFLCDV